MSELITKDMLMADIINKHPDVVEIMQKYGLHCFGCSVNLYESLEAGWLGHGMPEEEMGQMLSEMNEAASHSSGTTEKKDINIEYNGIAIMLTEKATSALKGFLESENKKGYGLRIGVVRGGCSGYSYSMDFEQTPRSDDIIIQQDEIKVFVDPESIRKLKGCTVDYIDSLQGAGFKINNPNAEKNCGCGKSFS